MWFLPDCVYVLKKGFYHGRMCNINCFYLSTDTRSQEEKSRCQMAPVSLSAATASSSLTLTWWPTREGSEWSSPTVTCTMQLCKMLIQWRTSPPLKSLQGWVDSFYSIESAFFFLLLLLMLLLSSIIMIVVKNMKCQNFIKAPPNSLSAPFPCTCRILYLHSPSGGHPTFAKESLW